MKERYKLSRKYEVGSVHKNRHNQSYVIIDRLPNRKARIRFIDTGYETEIFISNNKTVLDRSHLGFSKTMEYSIGDILENPRGEKAEILDYRPVSKLNGTNRYEHLLKFLDTGFEVWADCYNFKEGKTVDRLKPSVHGIGSIGYPPEEVYPLKNNKEYRLWARIMLRCSDGYSNEGYKEVTCSERWKRFDFFYEDVKELYNYDLWKKYSESDNKNPYEIDKDILVLDNKVYSKETCIFVEKSINAGFTSTQNPKNKRIQRDKILKEMEVNGKL